jgi:hypothetical protein
MGKGFNKSRQFNLLSDCRVALNTKVDLLIQFLPFINKGKKLKMIKTQQSTDKFPMKNRKLNHERQN